MLPPPRRLVDADLAAHRLDELLGDGQAEARAAEFSRMAGIGLDEFAEDLVALFLRHADAGIAHLEIQEAAVRTVDHAHRKLDAAALGELDRVADQIGQDLAQPHAVAAHHRGDGRIDDGDQFDVLVVRPRAGELDHGFDQGTQIDLVVLRA
ncbi:MAG: hypothetical protein WDM81_00075 [Rhizomicrobium sp.]